MKKPTKVLCKRSLTSGKDHWWDDTVTPPVRHERENRMLIKGQWYDVVDNEHDQWNKKDKTFTIIDSQGNLNLHFMYSVEDKDNFPDHCDMYGPRDYEKWFYTPEELVEVEAGTYKESYKVKHAIKVLVGNYHWAKLKEEDGGEWIIARAFKKHSEH